mmetsp:Transcript_29347/g.57601  ORF Transcript_29347/g.57601 Transcript_29347/m.57601 type:complete len:139 (+) Transcript_29347:1162-1578(+)
MEEECLPYCRIFYIHHHSSDHTLLLFPSFFLSVCLVCAERYKGRQTSGQKTQQSTEFSKDGPAGRQAMESTMQADRPIEARESDSRLRCQRACRDASVCRSDRQSSEESDGGNEEERKTARTSLGGLSARASVSSLRS